MKKLNLGCGISKKIDYINVDILESLKPDIVYNLESFPYPFKAESFDLIEANHILEHLSEPFEVMKELHRIVKKGGIIIIRVPHFSRALTHPQHKRGFDVSFPYYFDNKYLGNYTGIQLNCVNMRLKWFAQKHLMKKILPKVTYYALLIIGSVIDFFANVFPMFCSRVWCFWVGGFYEIEFAFKKE